MAAAAEEEAEEADEWPVGTPLRAAAAALAGQPPHLLPPAPPDGGAGHHHDPALGGADADGGGHDGASTGSFGTARGGDDTASLCSVTDSLVSAWGAGGRAGSDDGGAHTDSRAEAGFATPEGGHPA